jgi:hypothetical protein
MKKLSLLLIVMMSFVRIGFGQEKQPVNKAETKLSTEKVGQDFVFSKKTNNAEIQKMFWEDTEVKAFTALSDAKSNTKMINLKGYNLSKPVLDSGSGYYTMIDSNGKKTNWYSVMYTAQDEKTGKIITLGMLKNQEGNDSKVWANDGVSFYKLKQDVVRKVGIAEQDCHNIYCYRCQGAGCTGPMPEPPKGKVN